MNDQSFTKVPAQRVIQCAENFISKRVRAREEILRREAQALMKGNPRLRALTFGLWGRPKATCIEQAIELARRSEAYANAKWVGGYWESRAEELLALASSSADGQVLLSSNHVWILDHE